MVESMKMMRVSIVAIDDAFIADFVRGASACD